MSDNGGFNAAMISGLGTLEGLREVGERGRAVMKSLAEDGERGHAVMRSMADAGSAAALAPGAEGERFQEAGRLSRAAVDLVEAAESAAAFHSRLDDALKRLG